MIFQPELHIKSFSISSELSHSYLELAGKASVLPGDAERQAHGSLGTILEIDTI